MWTVVCVALGVLVGLLVLWSRAGRSHPSRWWAARGDGSTLDERMVLFILPGIALALLGLGPVLQYDEFDRSTHWLLAFVPLIIAGGALTLWGGFQLPVPRWYLPRWLRPARDRSKGAS